MLPKGDAVNGEEDRAKRVDRGLKFMDSMGIKAQPVMRKAKKKQVKDEFDRQKQAEKKKRRLEKALATSAAIISELEKKKQKKKEQQRLEEEGAAIAEAVALHVLLEDETNDPSKFAFSKDGIFKCLDRPRNFNLLLGRERSSYLYQESRSCSQEHISFGWHDLRKDHCSFSSGHHDGNVIRSYSNEIGWGLPGISAGQIAAKAVSSLQIAEGERKD